MFGFLKKLFDTKHPLPQEALGSEANPVVALDTSDKSDTIPIIHTVKKAFHFLETEYHFNIQEDALKNNQYRLLYEKDERKVYLSLDFDTDKLAFFLIRGRNSNFKRDLDTEAVRDFFWFFKHFEPELTWQKLQPSASSWESVIQLNAALLQKYGEPVLSGEDWF